MNYFDLHCDTAYELFTRKLKFNNDTLSVTSNNANTFENWQQVFAIWIKDDAEKPWELYRNILKDIKSKLIAAPRNLTPLLSVEGGALLENDLERTEILKNDGIKMLTLVWNGKNRIAGGVNCEKELTDFGKKVINKLNSLKIATDLSHINEKGFYKAVELAEFPIATHSNCFEICPNKRNLKLNQIKEIIGSGGIIGLTFYPQFSGNDVFEGLYRNIFFLCNKGYENSIALGSDFDGGEMDIRLCKAAQIPRLYGYLHKRGIQKQLLNKIFYENAHNFIAKLS